MKNKMLLGILSLAALAYGCETGIMTTYPPKPKQHGTGGETATEGGGASGEAGVGGAFGGLGGAGGFGGFVASGGFGGSSSQGGLGGVAGSGQVEGGHGGLGTGGSAGYGGYETGGAGGVEDCSDLTGKFTTFSQGGWHNNPTAVQFINDLFVSGIGKIVIGKESLDYALFNNADAIKDFLPQGGSPDILQGQYINPVSTPAGVLGGQTLALTLNIYYNEKNTSCEGFGNLLVIDEMSSCYDLSVQEVLDKANSILAGEESVELKCLTPAKKINICVEKINLNFLGGAVNNGYLGLPE